MNATSRNLVVIPTRGRAEVIESRIRKNVLLSKTSDYFLSIDSDDKGDYSWAQAAGIRVIRGEPNGMNAALNRVVTDFISDYEFVSFMGDDHAVRTIGWDEKLIEPLEIRGFGVAYGDDLMSQGALPTFAMISSNIVRPLGYLAPPRLKHMYLDNFWLALGAKMGSCHYLQEVVVEHLHHSTGKSHFDETYKATNQNLIKLRDQLIFNSYLKFEFPREVRRIRTALGPLWSES